MKVQKKEKDKGRKIKKKPVTKVKKENVMIVAQEFKFARMLSGNEKKVRDRVLKTLKKWLQNCFQKDYVFKEDDFIRVWKGLFYAVWMSDKPLVQEDLCESISEILDLFPPEHLRSALLMVKAGFQVLAKEWYGIDNHRMDKFLMLVRRYLRGSLRCLLRCKWSEDSCKAYTDTLANSDGLLSVKTPYYARNALSMALHVVDIYLEELSKVSKGEIPDKSLALLLEPFVRLVCGSDRRDLTFAARRLLTDLLRQSDPGLEYQARTRVWQQLGCPAGGPEALEPVNGDDDNVGEQLDDDEDLLLTPLDPRAGRVNVTLATLPVPAARLALALRRHLVSASSKDHKRAKICLQRFEELSKNSYPLRVKSALSRGPEPPQPAAERQAAALRLHSLEKRLVRSSDELALRGLSRKHRKRLVAKARAGLSIVEDVPHNTATDDGWHVEESEANGKRDANKENEEVVKKNKSRNKKKRKAAESGTEAKKPKMEKVKGNKSKVEKIIKEKVQKIKTKKDKKVEILKKETNVTTDNKTDKSDTPKKKEVKEKTKRPKLLVASKIKNYQKPTSSQKASPKAEKECRNITDTPKKVKFVLKNNSMQKPVDYYKSVRQSPSIPFDGAKKPIKTNLKPSTPSPINPFFKKKYDFEKLKMRKVNKRR